MRLSFKNSPISILIIFLTIFGLSSGVSAATIRLAWDPNPPEDEVAGYAVYYGTTSGNYKWTVDVGNVTTCELTGLTPGVTYYIALTAYDMYDNESDFSDEVSGEGKLIPPFVTLQINNGATSTTSRIVTLNNTATNGPTHYKASERSDFKGALWLVYKGAPKFKLSAGAGTKSVYFMAKNIDGKSSATSDTIILDGPAVTSFQINSGAASTARRQVTLNNTAINSPKYYKASERSDFKGALWVEYKEAPKFKLSAGAGTKTVYFKVKNGVDQSPVVNDTITLEGPAVTSFQINGGAASTASRTVTLNNTAINSPTYYKASERSDFKGALWVEYKEAPKFTLRVGAGTKTVYFKVKNGVDQSPVVNDTITLE